uniref:Uncharacterized protein n=1 Tax=Percolomonas cosmopolitus TaxID=63605 RepID=A0A7S1KT57_9EUKA|mmetsp:Transcript_6029/g.22802  ORF Transcript_6029/g.22802 Transcript_6029/m.22802 type:complete len:145 (+) Transcript_6029:3480-3914(+)
MPNNNPQGINQYSSGRGGKQSGSSGNQYGSSGRSGNNQYSNRSGNDRDAERDELENEIQEIRQEFEGKTMTPHSRGVLGADSRMLKSIEKYGDSHATYEIASQNRSNAGSGKSRSNNPQGINQYTSGRSGNSGSGSSSGSGGQY